MKSGCPRHAVVAMYESRLGAKLAFNALRAAGLNVNRLTIVGESRTADDVELRFPGSGIPARRLVTYERDVRSGKFLVLANGSANVMGQVCALLGTTGPLRLTAHAA